MAVIQATHRQPFRRLKLAQGVAKALFTTSPIKTTEVVVCPDGRVEILSEEESRVLEERALAEL
jgi:hypothetical protein